MILLAEVAVYRWIDSSNMNSRECRVQYLFSLNNADVEGYRENFAADVVMRIIAGKSEKIRLRVIGCPECNYPRHDDIV